LKLIFVFFVICNFSYANVQKSKSSFQKSLAEAIKGMEIQDIAVLQKKAFLLSQELEQLGNPVEVSGGVGKTTVGSFSGGYDEFEISYEIELAGDRRRYKSEVIPVLEEIQDIDIKLEINKFKFFIIKLFLHHNIISERVEHLEKRKQILIGLDTFLKNYKLKSPQALANKELIRLKVEDFEIELKNLDFELKGIKDLLSKVFSQKYLDYIQNQSPLLADYLNVYEKVKKQESNLQNYLNNKMEVLKIKKDISSLGWLPDLRIYAGRNNQDQLGTKPQVTEYFGLGIKIPTDFTFSKKNKIADIKLKAQEYENRRNLIESHKQLNSIRNNIQRKINYLKINNKKILRKNEAILIENFKNLSKGLVSIQSYLELDSVIHERLHLVLNYKLSLLKDFFQILEIKKQNVDVLGELM
jgi:hypothetical protein